MSRLVRVNAHLTVGGEPSLGHLRRLGAERVRSVLDLRLEDEPGPAPPPLEADIVQRQGIEYHHLPVPPEPVTPRTAARFCDQLRRLPTPILVHSRTGRRAAVLTMIYLGAANGWSAEYTLQQSRHLGLPLDDPHDVETLQQSIAGPACSPAS